MADLVNLYHRPDDVPHIGNFYYPCGLPLATDTSSVSYNVSYLDEQYNDFSILYTVKQANDFIKLTGAWTPYIPFLIGGRPPLK